MALSPLYRATALTDSQAVVKMLLDAGADPKARAADGGGGVFPVDLIPDGYHLRGTDVYWRLNEARYR